MTGASQTLVPAELDDDAGQAMIEAARGLDPLTARSMLTRLFPEASAEVLRAAVTQSHLQQRAARHYPFAAALVWTSEGLEQASRPAASAYRAATLRAAGITHAVDLTCGLGLDLVAMAQQGLRMVGVEQDPAIADLAARNVARLGLSEQVRIVAGSCEDPAVLAQLPRGGAWFVDPARRPEARRPDGTHVRLRDPEQWSPPWSWVTGLADLVDTANGPDVVVAKTSPAIAHGSVSTAATQWLSVNGDLVEAVAWWGLGEPGSRCAVLLDADSPDAHAVQLCAGGAPVAVSGLPVEGAWLVEPDPAVIRAGAVSDLGAAIGATLVDEHLAYLSGTRPMHPDDPRGRGWQVQYAGPYDPGVLRRLCAEAGVVRVEISGRGRRLDPQRVARELRLPGGPGNVATLLSLGLGSPRRTAVVLGVAPPPD